MRQVMALLVIIVFPGAAAASIEGDWLLSLQDKQRTLVGLLEIEKSEDGWVAYLEGGPVSVVTDGDDVVIVADSRDVRGFVFDRRMTGSIDGDFMSGTYEQVGAAAQKEAPGPWQAKRQISGAGDAPEPNPVDLSGTWVATQED